MFNTEIWKFLAGLGFFIYGMSQLETVLKNSSGRSFKLFLKRNTQNLFKSILGAAFITGIVQSSSVVSLVVLAFVESGIITFRNALGVILGTNLGTTLDSWIVATLGFKFNVLSYSMPVIAITTIGMFFFEKRRNLRNLLAVFFALGILFLGLGLMKEGALALVKDFDIKTFAHYNTFIFVIIGFILTTIIQSSSATIAITLTAIYAGIITFPLAAAIVIGSEIGTTIKILLWGMKGSSEKKRVALGNFMYNIFTASLAFIFLKVIIYFIEEIISIDDPLIGLVFFQTLINIISIILFIPFLNSFAKWLENKFLSERYNDNSYISKDLPELPVIAADIIKNETLNLLNKTRLFIKSILLFDKETSDGLLGNLKTLTRTYKNTGEEYNKLKQTEGDILAYHASIQQNNLSKNDAALMLQYVNAVRQTIYAAKAIKDIEHNINDFEASANDNLHLQSSLIGTEWVEFDLKLAKIIDSPKNKDNHLDIEELLSDAITHEETRKTKVMLHLKNDELTEVEASTLMNVHHELLSCKKSLLVSLNNLGTELLT